MAEALPIIFEPSSRRVAILPGASAPSDFITALSFTAAFITLRSSSSAPLPKISPAVRTHVIPHSQASAHTLESSCEVRSGASRFMRSVAFLAADLSFLNSRLT